MTSYFDDIGSVLDDMARGTYPHACRDIHDALRQVEEKLVYDVDLAASMPGFPEDIRQAINAAIVKWGAATLPTYVAHTPEADAEDHEGSIRVLGNLSSDLHDLFRELGRREIPGLCDKPDRCVLVLINPRSEERDAMFRSAGRYNPPAGYGQDDESSGKVAS